MFYNQLKNHLNLPFGSTDGSGSGSGIGDADFGITGGTGEKDNDGAVVISKLSGSITDVVKDSTELNQ